jgi:nicotinate-nucleotide pyrophosphorylase (carboxylating)
MIDLRACSSRLLPTEDVVAAVQRWLGEDGLDACDVTSRSIIDESTTGSFDVVARQRGVVAGLDPLHRGLSALDGAVMQPVCADGTGIEAGERLSDLSGKLLDILAVERTVLNLLGHMCGIATRTAACVDAVAGLDCVVCDTRKTTPGLRRFDKYAVACGGGTPHRLGLDDAVLYKDNHLVGIETTDWPDRLRRAIARARDGRALSFVEVEVDTIDQLDMVLDLDVDIVLLDNMSLENLATCVGIRSDRSPGVLLEASGGITLASAREVAQTGVDRIAVGSLTHGAPWLDISLDASASQ